jgi:hypothetical protein
LFFQLPAIASKPRYTPEVAPVMSSNLEAIYYRHSGEADITMKRTLSKTFGGSFKHVPYFEFTAFKEALEKTRGIYYAMVDQDKDSRVPILAKLQELNI